jgi:hypothetical protein
VKRLPCEITRLAEVEQVIVERNITLGVDLIALRNAAGSNHKFSRMARRAYDIDPVTAGLYVRVAKAFADRRDITDRVNWQVLVALSVLPETIRQKLEQRILAGEFVGAADIRRSRPKNNTAPPRAA